MDQVLQSLKDVFRSMKGTGDRALDQLSFADMLRTPTAEMNSIAVLIQHLNGNMLSRWTDFLNSDGEKPWRDRDLEFEQPVASSSEELLRLWQDGWVCFFQAVDALKPEDLSKTITIRGEPHSVVQALHRQIYHYSYHVGQIVFLARLCKGSDWRTLSIARGQSKEYKPRGRTA